MTNLRDKFDRFYRENASLIQSFKTSIKSHPVDNEELQKWKDIMTHRIEQRYGASNKRQCDALLLFVNRFSTKLRNISHLEFFERMEQVMDDLITQFKQNDENTKVVLILEREIGKSGVWLSLLYWPKLARYITHVLTLDDAFVLSRETDDIIHIIYLDDASYSGSQVAANLRGFLYSNIRRYLVIPYISATARKKFQDTFEKRHQLWISGYSEVFYSLYHGINRTDYLTQDVRFWESYFCDRNIDQIPDLHTLYFDHKLPDGVSVYAQLIGFSYLMPKESAYISVENIEVGKGFITNCSGIDSPYHAYPAMVLSEQTSKMLCPNPTYKGLSYMFSGKTFTDPKEDFLENLEKLKSMACSNCSARNPEFTCSQCKQVVFCNTACQIQHWPIHKKFCE